MGSGLRFMVLGALVACGCGAPPNRYVTRIPAKTADDGAGTLEVHGGAVLDFQLALLRLRGRAATDHCVLYFEPCSMRDSAVEFLVTAQGAQACMYDYCGNRVDELAMQLWSGAPPWLEGAGEAHVRIRGKGEGVHPDPVKLEDVVARFGPRADQSMGTVVLEPQCEQRMASVLRDVETLNRGRLTVLLLMHRNSGRSTGMPDRCMYF